MGKKRLKFTIPIAEILDEEYISLPEAIRRTGRHRNTLLKYIYEEYKGTYLEVVQDRNGLIYTKPKWLHEYLRILSPKYRAPLPDTYVTPPGCQPLFVPDQEFQDTYGLIPVENIRRILGISDTYAFDLIKTGLLKTIEHPEYGRMVTRESLVSYIAFKEEWRETYMLEEAYKEEFADVIKEAHNEALTKARKKVRKELAAQARRDRSKGKVGRPKGSSDTKKRRLKKIEIYPQYKEEFIDNIV